MKNLFKLSILFLIVLISFSSCRKKEKANIEAISKDDATKESYSAAVTNEVNNTNDEVEDEQFKAGITFKNARANSILADSCADITWTIDSSQGTLIDSYFVSSITVVYNNCIRDGRTWNGTITWTKTGRWYWAGAKTIATTSNLTIDGYKIEGSRTITTNNVTIQLVLPFIDASFNVDEANGKITTPENETITWASSRTVRWTWETLLEIFLRVDGTASGVTREGIDYTIDIDKTLKAKAGCKWIIEGTFSIASEALKTDVVVDYGDGTCDNKATYTMNGGKEIEFDLK